MNDFLFDPARIDPGARNEEQKILTVSRLNALVKNNLETSFGEVSVKGEVSNLRIPASGHRYFTLKDEQAEIAAVWFRDRSLKSSEKLEDGKEIIAVGNVSLYEARGTYQIIVRRITTKGKGDFRERFEQLVAKLRKEGLFNEEHKKRLPVLPGIIGVITSKTGAAVKDITNMIWHRFPGAHIVIGPVPVQGEGAAERIAEMIGLFNKWAKADVLIVGRGGGSLEDLWAFNEEIVARAIFRSDIPVISAVGHEIDVTIADMVADVRALTPTKAGEMAVPDIRQEYQLLDSILERCRLAIESFLRSRRAELEYYRSHRIFAVPGESLRMRKQAVSELGRQMRSLVRNSCNIKREIFKRITEVLETLNPLSVMKRGFTYTEDSKGRRIGSINDVADGDTIKTKLPDGTITSEVLGVDQANA